MTYPGYEIERFESDGGSFCYYRFIREEEDQDERRKLREGADEKRKAKVSDLPIQERSL